MSKKKTAPGKYAAKKKKSRKGTILLLAILVVLLAAIAAMLFLIPKEPAENVVPETITQTETAAETAEKTTTLPLALPASEESVNLGYGVYVTDMGSYTGMFMEDGTDEIVSGVLMLVVKNTGDQDIQYAEITMAIGEQNAQFSLSTLPVDESVVLLEKNRMSWDETIDYSAILPKVENIAYFQEPVSVQEEKLKIGIVDGAINVTNISGEDIAGNIVVYYKNAAQDTYYGGITYRITIEGGLKTDEIRQVMTNHASDTGSKIMFVTISQ